MQTIRSSEITPEHIYLSRRKFMVGAGSLAAGAVALSACAGMPNVPGAASDSDSGDVAAERLEPAEAPAPLGHEDPFASTTTDELGDPLNSYQEITNYNNFYEFSLDKGAVNPLSKDFNTVPWEIEVTGLANNPQTFALEDILTKFTQEERIYRLRCVEAWSMVIPWVGFPVGDLLREVDPKSEAKYVKFTTVMRPEEMPGQRGRAVIEYPYVEGLRIDEAMNPLAIFATGMYGKPLVPANGAPFRLVVPWKYGFKSIKSIVKIELTDEMPVSTWMKAAPREYGFYANVNPDVNHPRWSQATERRIGESGRRDTLPFNGYAEEVAALYDGMDLRENF
ncbi:MAG: protein-methionine-sulfoxide reductase catalytic subunit MsrP [Caldilineaceae bacterium]|nr:protein-methionine-sulfoxide reductase catalytic subunit MsrP [Caldilineaceae bacterium]